MERIGLKIKELRKIHHLTQAQLAEKLFVSPQAISKWERSENDPDIQHLPGIAAIFNCSIDELFSETFEIQPNKEGLCPKCMNLLQHL